MRILMIEDDRATVAAVELMLAAEGWSVYDTDLGAEGVDLGKIYDYDVILLDLGLPDMSGMDVLRKLRAAAVKTPIIVVSGSRETETKVRSFGLGADDYLTKPFHREELTARIRAVSRRSNGHAQAVITTGPLSVNLDRHACEIEGAPIHLTASEYAILELLSLKKGATVTKDMFLTHLYDGKDEPDGKIIDVFVCKLRRKLREATHGQELIETVWGRGYTLKAPKLPAADAA